jgi:hypothetical protein
MKWRYLAVRTAEYPNLDPKTGRAFAGVKSRLGDIIRHYRAVLVEARPKPPAWYRSKGKYKHANAVAPEAGGLTVEKLNEAVRLFGASKVIAPPEGCNGDPAKCDCGLSGMLCDPRTPWPADGLTIGPAASGKSSDDLPVVEAIPLRSFPYQWALSMHGSQRKAAAALGVALSTFQRRLAKEQAT